MTDVYCCPICGEEQQIWWEVEDGDTTCMRCGSEMELIINVESN